MSTVSYLLVFTVIVIISFITIYYTYKRRKTPLSSFQGSFQYRTNGKLYNFYTDLALTSGYYIIESDKKEFTVFLDYNDQSNNLQIILPIGPVEELSIIGTILQHGYKLYKDSPIFLSLINTKKATSEASLEIRNRDSTAKPDTNLGLEYVLILERNDLEMLDIIRGRGRRKNIVEVLIYLFQTSIGLMSELEFMRNRMNSRWYKLKKYVSDINWRKIGNITLKTGTRILTTYIGVEILGDTLDMLPITETDSYEDFTMDDSPIEIEDYSDANQVSTDNIVLSNEPSFTGNDKYTDNKYNSEQYDYWKQKSKEALERGDTRAADAALKTAKKHLGRITTTS